MWNALIANFAIVGFFAAVWTNLADWSLRYAATRVNVALGGLMGVASLVAMAFSAELFDGIYFDLRAVPVAIAAFFGGVPAGLIAGSLVMLLRLAEGGTGTLAGIVLVLLTLAAGVAGHLVQRRGNRQIVVLAATSLLVGLIPALTMLALEPELRALAVKTAALPMALLSSVTFLVAGIAIARAMSRAADRALLLGAVAGAPDYFYIKDRRSQIIAANRNVALANKVDDVRELQGKTDYDLAPIERALVLAAEEEELMASGRAMLDKHEVVTDAAGKVRHYLTSKSPVHIGSGAVIGLVGVTKDISEQKEIERLLTENRNRLSFVLQEMSDGVALISSDGYIVMANDRYRELFPRTGHLRVAGAFLPAILQEVVSSGEQPAVSEENSRQWISDVMQSYRIGGEQLIRLFDGRWLQVKTTVHEQGVATSVVSDVTKLKRAETDLLVMTKKLELLSITDGLTQLVNRRGFDDALEKEFARARRSDKPISVILLDIDRFKAFNDRYGHLEGDECLKLIAGTVRGAVKRPGDTVARYGGEEIAIILPDTNSQGAYVVAEAIRSAVRGLGKEHEASEKKIVTASIGVATFEGIDPLASSRLLLARADEALYLAKGGGRDRVVVWSDPKLPFRSIAYA